MAKEIISKRYKTYYWLVLGLSICSIITCIRNTQFAYPPYFQTINHIAFYLFIVSALLWGIILADPRGVIEKDRDTIILVRGMRKIVIPLSDIRDVFLTPHPTQKDKIQKHAVTIKAIIKGKEKSLVCSDVIDPEVVVEKMKSIIG
jgi:hypothetical protein